MHIVTIIWLVLFGFAYFKPDSPEINRFWRFAFLASFFKNIARITDLGLMSFYGGHNLASKYIHNGGFGAVYLYLYFTLGTPYCDYETLFYYFSLGILAFYISLMVVSRALSDHSYGFWMQGNHFIDMIVSLFKALAIFVIIGSILGDFSTWWLVVPIVTAMAILATVFALSAKLFLMIGLCYKAFQCILGFTVFTSGIMAVFTLQFYIYSGSLLWPGILFLGYFNVFLTLMNIKAIFNTYENIGTTRSERIWNEVQEEGMNVILGFTGLDTIKDGIDIAGWLFGTSEDTKEGNDN